MKWILGSLSINICLFSDGFYTALVSDSDSSDLFKFTLCQRYSNSQCLVQILGDLLATSDIEAALIFGWPQIFVPKELALWKGVAWCFEEMGLKKRYFCWNNIWWTNTLDVKRMEKVTTFEVEVVSGHVFGGRGLNIKWLRCFFCWFSTGYQRSTLK